MAIHIVSKNYVFASLLAHRNSGCLIAKRSFGLSGPTTIKAVVDSHRHSGRPTKGTHMKAYKPPKTRRHGRHVPVLRTRQSSSELRGLAARLSLSLLTKPDGVAVFWPASGVAAGALIALGPRT